MSPIQNVHPQKVGGRFRLELGTLLEEAKSLHDERAQAIDAAYDDQTDHSRNRLKQGTWDRAIAQALRDSKASKVVDLLL